MNAARPLLDRDTIFWLWSGSIRIRRANDQLQRAAVAQPDRGEVAHVAGVDANASGPGKTLTITTTGKDAKGQNIDSVAVYDKQ